MTRAYPREWLPPPGVQMQQRLRWRPTKRGRTPILDKDAIAKPSKCMPAAAALEPLVIITVIGEDEEPLLGSKKLKMKQRQLSYYVRFVMFCFGGGVFYVITLLIESHHL
jgi:hypothetical protein